MVASAIACVSVCETMRRISIASGTRLRAADFRDFLSCFVVRKPGRSAGGQGKTADQEESTAPVS